MSRYQPFAVVALGLAALSMSSFAHACCPSGGNTGPKSALGLGQGFPSAANESIDANWRVYNFERDGIHYMQVNDSNGAVRAAVGRIADTMWVLPVGSDADRVNTDSIGVGLLIYRDEAIEVRRLQTPDGDAWSVVLSDR